MSLTVTYSLQIYQEAFETKFLESTEELYHAEGQMLIQEWEVSSSLAVSSRCHAGLWSRSQRLGLETYQRLVSVSSREKLSMFWSREADVSVSSSSRPLTSLAQDQCINSFLVGMQMVPYAV